MKEHSRSYEQAKRFLVVAIVAMATLASIGVVVALAQVLGTGSPPDNDILAARKAEAGGT